MTDLRIETTFSSLHRGETSNFPPLPRGEGRGEGARNKYRDRKKRHIAWEQAELQSNGLYARNLADIAIHFPQLTETERRVAALVKAMLPSWKIAQILVISEKAVENYRVRIRRKIGCSTPRLETHLSTI